MHHKAEPPIKTISGNSLPTIKVRPCTQNAQRSRHVEQGKALIMPGKYADGMLSHLLFRFHKGKFG